MKITKAVFLGLVVLAFGVMTAAAAEHTWTGKISDSMCGTSHAKMTAGHPNMTDRACALACVKAGAKYVFVSDGKVYQIANQNLPDLAKEAGDKVSLTGDVNGTMITVSKVMMDKKK